MHRTRDRGKGCEMEQKYHRLREPHIVNRGGGAWSRGVLCRGVFD